ncbi:MAG: DUF4142 domain-containing protein [Verrucomicrobiales bacterium]
MKLNLLSATLSASLLAWTATPALAADEEKKKSADAKTGELSSFDAKFIKETAECGNLEIKLGELAQQKGATAEVKDFGKKMAADHSKANEELRALASTKGISLADEPTEKKNLVEKLTNLSGAAFDEEYKEQMLKAHKKDVAAFEEASRKVKDPDLKMFIDKTLPILREHLQHAAHFSGEQKPSRDLEKKNEKTEKQRE